MDCSAIEERVGSWVRAGIISADQGERILALEQRSEPPPPTGAPIEPVAAATATRRRALLSEVIGYVGAAFAFSAIGLLVGEFWDVLAVWAQLATVGVPAVIAVGAGQLLHGRQGAAVQRLVGVLWALAVAATAGFLTVLALEVLSVPEEWLATVVGGGGALLGGVLLYRGRHVLVQLITFVALGTATFGTLLALSPLGFGQLAGGILVLGGGATWALAGAGGWLGPRISAEATGAVFMLIGSQVLGGATGSAPGLLVGVLVALTLVAASLAGERTHLLYIGAFGLFVSVPRVVLVLFADTLGAPATLLLTGLLLILMAVGLGRIRRTKEVQHG